AALARQPDVVHIRHVARNADRRLHDRFGLVEPKVPQQFRQDLLAAAFIHGFVKPIAVALGVEPVAPPDGCAWRLAEDFRLVEDRQLTDPVQMLKTQKPAASRVAAGELSHLIEELLARRSDRERHPARVGYAGDAEERVWIAESFVRLSQAIPQRPGPSGVQR